MDGVSVAASIIGIATAGVQISIKLINFSNQVGTAPERIRYIGTDVSLTAGVLQQLGDLMKQKPGDNETLTIFSEGGLVTTRSSATTCESIFKALDDTLKKASKQLRDSKSPPGGQILLSKGERLKWPFLQPELDTLRAELRDSRQTLMLILQVTTLAYSKRLAELNKPSNLSREDQEELVNSILAIQRQQEQKSHEASDPPAYHANEDTKPNPQFSQKLPSKPLASSGGPLFSFAAMTSGSHENEGTRSRDNPESQASGSKESPGGQSWNAGTNQHGTPDKLASNPLERVQVTSMSNPTKGEASPDPSSSGSQESSEKKPQAKQDLQVWNMVPVVESVFCGYKYTWLMSKMTIPVHKIEKHLQVLKRQDSRSILHQLDALTWKEREFLDAFVNGNLPDNTLCQDVNFLEISVIDLIAVVVERTAAPDERFSGVERRHIKVFATIEQTRIPSDHRKDRNKSGPFGPFEFERVSKTGAGLFGRGRVSNSDSGLFGFGRAPNNGSGLFGRELPLARPTYIKVHRKHMDTEVLDMHELPWEWEDLDSQYIIISRWIPEGLQDLLFKETEDLRRLKLSEVDSKDPSPQTNPIEDFHPNEFRRDNRKESKRSSRFSRFLPSRREKTTNDLYKPEKDPPKVKAGGGWQQRLGLETKSRVKDEADEERIRITALEERKRELLKQERERLQRQKLDIEVRSKRKDNEDIEPAMTHRRRDRKEILREAQEQEASPRRRRRTRSLPDSALRLSVQPVLTKQREANTLEIAVDDVERGSSDSEVSSAASSFSTKSGARAEWFDADEDDEAPDLADHLSVKSSGRSTPIYGRNYPSEHQALDDTVVELKDSAKLLLVRRSKRPAHKGSATPPEQEEDRMKVVDELLAKYTTLYSQSTPPTSERAPSRPWLIT